MFVAGLRLNRELKSRAPKLKAAKFLVGDSALLKRRCLHKKHATGCFESRISKFLSKLKLDYELSLIFLRERSGQKYASAPESHLPRVEVMRREEKRNAIVLKRKRNVIYIGPMEIKF